jgi:hypothetical protein
MHRLLLLALTLTGCAQLGLSCTEMGCVGTLSIYLSRELTSDASVVVELDGASVDCPVNPAGGTPSVGCAVVSGDGGAVITIDSGSVAFEEVLVRISEGGAEAVEYAVTPEWGERYYPNGKACDGVDGGCVGGEANLALE